jgi:ABC-type multidrug transport system fused ATPase/permease subunit
MALGTMLCCNNQLTVGEFSALVSIFKRIGKKVLLLNRAVIRMIRSGVALKDLSELLNMQTGVQVQVRRTRKEEEIHQKQLARRYSDTLVRGKSFHLQKKAKEKKSKKAKKGKKGAINITPIDEENVDLTPLTPLSAGNDREQLRSLKLITIRDCTFTYPPLGHNTNVLLTKGLNLDIPLGGMVWMAAAHDHRGIGIGRLTFLKLLAGMLTPSSGSIIVPPHLRIRMVPLEPMLFAKSLLFNLTLGVDSIREELVWQVAEQVGLSAELLGQGEVLVGAQGHNLRLCDRQAVCIARGILCDPDVLLLHRPGTLFTSKKQRRVVEAIRSWMDTSLANSDNVYAWHTAKSKTAILSCDHPDAIEGLCDLVLQVSASAAPQIFDPAEYAAISKKCKAL